MEGKHIRSFAIRELRVDGEMTAAERQRLQERAFTATELIVSNSGGVILPLEDVARVLAERPQLRDCYDWNCHISIADQLKANRVLIVRIERKGPSGKPGNWEVSALSFAADAIRLVGTKSGTCEGCVAEDLIARDILSKVITPLIKNDQDLPLCRLKVDSKPTEATLALDATQLGRTPFERTVYAGTHTVSIEEKGFARGQAVINCPKDGNQGIRFDLAPTGTTSSIISPGPTATVPGSIVESPPKPVPTDRRLLFRGLGFGSLALAAAGVVGLGVAAGYNGQPSSGCQDGRCRFQYDTTTAMAVSGVAAGVFAVGTIVLLIKGYGPAPRSTAWLIPSAGGAAVGGRF